MLQEDSKDMHGIILLPFKFNMIHTRPLN